MSFSRRHLDVQFIMGEGQIGDTGSNTATVSGLRCSATIAKAGGLSQSQMNLSIYGLPLKLMNQFSTLGKPLARAYKNYVQVKAYSDDSSPALAFRGTIQDAWADANASPDVRFTVTAFQGYWENNNPAPPLSFQGSVSVALIMQKIAAAMGVDFENNGVTATLSNQYLDGTLFTQAGKVARAAGINWIMDDTKLAIWPKGQSRQGPAATLSPGAGLVDYPSHTANGISLTAQYSPSFLFGGLVTVSGSILTPANNTWTVFNMAHELESEVFDGKWFTHLDCVQLGQPLPLS